MPRANRGLLAGLRGRSAELSSECVNAARRRRLPQTLLLLFPSLFPLQTTTGSEERIHALLRNANARLLAHPESRRRLLQLKAPAVLVPYQGGLACGGAVAVGLGHSCRAGSRALPAAPRTAFRLLTATLQLSRPSTHPPPAGVRMVEDDVSIVPFNEAYDTHCARYGREADAPILAFKARCCTAEGITSDAAVRLEAYQEVVDRSVTENMFSQFMYKTMVENNLSMWIIKKQFALSAAMSGACIASCPPGPVLAPACPCRRPAAAAAKLLPLLSDPLPSLPPIPLPSPQPWPATCCCSPAARPPSCSCRGRRAPSRTPT